jgi:hypothetical protein
VLGTALTLGTSLGAIDLLGTLDGFELSDGKKLILGVPDGDADGVVDGLTETLGI